jgi:hypothetical protein
MRRPCECNGHTDRRVLRIATTFPREDEIFLRCAGHDRARILGYRIGVQCEARGRSFRLAAYAVCIEVGRSCSGVVPPEGEASSTLPGGRVEHGEDRLDAVIREVAEETGCDAEVKRLLGLDDRPSPNAS